MAHENVCSRSLCVQARAYYRILMVVVIPWFVLELVPLKNVSPPSRIIMTMMMMRTKEEVAKGSSWSSRILHSILAQNVKTT